MNSVSSLYGQWVQQTKGLIPNILPLRIFFADAQTGWVNGGTLKTTNGGETWIVNDSVGFYGQEFFFINDSVGWAADYDIYKTTNGGITWQEFPDSNVTPRIPSADYLFEFDAVWFNNATTGWAAGNYGAIAQTTDGGASWHFQHTNWSVYTNDDKFNAIQFTDSLHGWAVGSRYDDIRYRTTDGGRAWEGGIEAGTGRAYDLSFVDSLHGWVGNLAGLDFTTDGGQSWQQADINKGVDTNVFHTYQILGVKFLDTLNGWAAGVQYGSGDSAVILHTTDGGLYWDKYYPPGATFISSIVFPSKNVGYAVGDSGIILKYIAPSGVEERSPTTSVLFLTYPNPFSSVTTIDLSNMPSQDITGKTATLCIYNMLGEQIADLTRLLNGQGKIEFNASGLAPGVYFVRGNFGTRVFVKKIIVEK